MKRSVVVRAILLLALVTGTASVQAQKKVKLTDTRDSISYIIGQDIGNNFKKSQIDINVNVLLNGLTAAMNGSENLISEERKMAIMTKFQQELQKKQQDMMAKESEVNKVAGAAFLEKNLKQDGVKKTASGLQYKVLQEGAGDHPLAESKVTVHYEGKLIDGKIFDSSYERGQPATFPLNGVIRGWTEGLQLMNPGAIYEFYIPSDLAYGDRGNQAIPGGSTLIFKVELIKFE